MRKGLRILILEDVTADAAAMERQLKLAGLTYTAKRVKNRDDFARELESFGPDMVLADYRLSASNGSSALKLSRRAQADLPYIVVSDAKGEERAVECLKKGATDYVLKDKLARLGPIVKRAQAESQKRRQLKQAEAALAASQARYRSLVEASPDAILVAELDGKLTFANRQAQKLYGYGSLKQLLAVTFLDLVTTADHKKAAGILKRAQQNSQVHTDELSFIKRKGASFRAEISSAVINGDGGRPTAMMAVVRDISARREAEAARVMSLEKLEKVLDDVVRALAYTAEQRDPYTAGHQVEVARLSAAMAAEMELSPRQVEGVRVAATLHDIGKIGIPTEILVKPGKITESEMNVIKGHSRIGYEILSTIEFPWPVAQIVLEHHEREDGSGYPQGLRGDEIMLEARIICVADVIEAMSSHRPYRPAQGVESALEHVILNRGQIYYGPAVDACVSLFLEKKFEFSQVMAGGDISRDQ